MKIAYYFFNSLVFILMPLSTSFADSKDYFPVGALFSLSGFGAEEGKAELNAAVLAERDINEKGGIRGKKIKLIAEDIKSDLKETVTAFNKLVNADGVSAIVGPNWTEFASVAAPLAELKQTPMVAPSGNDSRSFVGRFSFTLWPPDEEAITPLEVYIQKKGLKRASVILSDNAYQETLYLALTKKLKHSNITFNDPARVSAGSIDFRSYITKIKSTKSDVVLAFLQENSHIGVFLKQRQELSLDLPILTTNALLYDRFVSANPKIAEGVICFDYLVPGGDKFLNRYKKEFKSDPSFGSARAYDALWIIKESIEKCGPSRREIAQCLRKEKFQGLVGEIGFDKNGVIKSPGASTYLVKYQDGKPVPHSP